MTAPVDRIGRYAVRHVIGTGGFATVYRAADERLDDDVAVKVLGDNHSLDPDVRARFVEEGRRLRRVRSPHVVTVHELGETDRAQPFLVLEWADRGDLAARVAHARGRGHRPGAGDVLAVARSVAAGLGVLHGHDLVHRDLTPRNLLLRSVASPVPSPDASRSPGLIGDDELLLLADLGLSKDLAVASGFTVAAGTSGFTPPEQRNGAGTVDRRADVWAASALVVWLACGHPPEEGDWRAALRRDGWPRRFAGVMERGLSERPDDRHPTIGDWLDALDASLAPPPPDPAAATGGGAPGSGGRGRGRWLRGLALVVACAVGVVVGAAVIGDGPGGSGGPSAATTELSDDRRRTTVEDHGMRIELEAPTELAVGDAATVSATVEGATTWLWIAPDGSVHDERPSLDLAPTSRGRATVRVLAIDEFGDTVEATHTLRVVEDGGP